VVVATSVDQLHGTNNLSKQTSLSEKGEVVNGRGDTPNRHDMLTGSSPDGRAIAGSDDTTCKNWTTSAAGAAMLGHHDRQGLKDDDVSRSWNSSHLSRRPRTVFSGLQPARAASTVETACSTASPSTSRPRFDPLPGGERVLTAADRSAAFYRTFSIDAIESCNIHDCAPPGPIHTRAIYVLRERRCPAQEKGGVT